MKINHIVQGKTGVGALQAFIQERYRIYVLRKIEHRPPPWTEDVILQRYKFCNVYRELDAVTIWIRENIREQFVENENLWFMLCAARQINWPPTLKALIESGSWPTVKWNPAKARKTMLQIQARGEKLYTGAYMINAHGKEPDDPDDKAFFTCYITLGRVWKIRNKVILPALQQNSLQAFCEALQPCHGWGKFTAAQIVADLKHTRYLKNAPDWWDWAVLGPGSSRGMNRVLGRNLYDRMNDKEAVKQLTAIRDYITKNTSLPKLCLQDTQNCLCEFDKYERARLMEGRPRTMFHQNEAYARDKIQTV